MTGRQQIFETDRNKAKQTSQTLLRGLKILELTASGKSNLPIRELAKEVNLPRSIVHRLVSTLEGEGYIQKNSTNPGYRLGTKLWSLGCAAIQGLEIREVARPYLEDLSSKTNELVALGVLDGREVVYLDKIDCSRAVRAYISIGGRAPAYCISTGKAILAYRGDDELIKIAASMKKFTDHTVIGLAALKKHLAEIRRRGYSINFGEWHEDLGGVASAIRDREGHVVAAIGITVPIHRLAKENIGPLGRLVMKAAATISNELGYGGLKSVEAEILEGQRSKR
jgi:IclR family transcriptional regulator, KDG regulon repressor